MFDFSDIPVIDIHVHTPLRWDAEDNILGLGDNDYLRVTSQVLPKDVDEALRRKVLAEVREHSEARPAAISILHYYDRTYNVGSSDRSNVDRFIRDRISQLGPTEYSERSFKRERIKWVLADQSYFPNETSAKVDAYPENMARWTFPLANIIQPTWAQAKGLEDIEEAQSAVREIIRTAKDNSCSGFKSIQGYFREFYLQDVSEDEASEAFMTLKGMKPDSFIESPARVPIYRNEKGTSVLKTYQDFLLKVAFSEAGKMGLPVLIHVAVGEVPQLKPWNNDPYGLYSIFDNEEIQRANTQFVLLHTGYPAHHVVGSIITQYPNVFVDLSWISHASVFTATILTEYLTIAPPQKVLHGSDGSHPDVIAFAAYSTKKSLSMIAKWLFDEYGWSESDLTRLAEAVLYKNAERIFGG